jgi:hypothetical protein
MPAPRALAWLDDPPAPADLAGALAAAGAATPADVDQLLEAVAAARAALEAAAREAFVRAPVSRSTAAFHSALPDLRPFVLYRLPGLLREAGLYTPDELRALAADAPAAWLAREATRQLAILASVRAAVRRLEAGELAPADFPAAIRSAAREAAAIQPSPNTPSQQEDQR